MMDLKQAFEAVVQALEAANQGQRFSLRDSATVFAALGVIAKELDVEAPDAKQPAPEEPVKAKGKK